MKRHRNVAAFILAGGASSRMGRDKGLLEFGGVPLIADTARLVEPLVNSVTVVGSPEYYAGLGVRAIADQGSAGDKVERRGPLAGIVTALAATRSDWNLILACDLPYLSRAWVNWLISRAVRSRCQAVVPQTARGLEPLAAVYRGECGPILAAALNRGVRKVTDAIARLRLELIREDEWRRLDPRGLVLKNMNTPQDYDEAVRAHTAAARDARVVTQRRRSRERRSAPRRSK